MNNPLLKSGIQFTPILPSPDEIYYKDFHFLDEPLIDWEGIQGQKLLSN
jgi:hypothetical protein